MYRNAIIVFCLVLLCAAPGSCSKKNNGGVSVNPDTIASGSDLAAILQRGRLMVGMDVSDIRYQPFELTDASGQIVGLDVDLAQMMADELGVSLEIVKTSWDGIIPALVDKKFDLIISSMVVTTERNKAINFSDPYYLSGKSLLIAARDTGRIDSYRDLNRKDTVVATTFVDDMIIDRYIPDADIVRFKSDEDAVREVVAGRAKAYIGDKALVIVFSEKYRNSTVALVEPFTFEPIGVGMRKGDVDLLNWVNNFIEIIRGDGRLEMLEKKWIRQYIPPSTEGK
jgi:polar amino acid transport system substrate-binding protein